jgi:hypothetical protein
MLRLNRFAAATSIAAAFCMSAASASAVELPQPVGPAKVQAYDGDANSAENRRHRRRHRDGIDGGDILAGVLILGGIAAVASAVENSNDRNRDYRDYPPPPPPRGYNDGYEYRGGDYNSGSTGLDRAADICADAVERTIDPVGSIDSVRRGPNGWDVDGTLRDGSRFGCTIGNDGRITDVRAERSYSGAAYEEDGNPDDSYGDEPSDDRPYYDDQTSADGQYDDETYARLRAQQGGNEGTGG